MEQYYVLYLPLAIIATILLSILTFLIHLKNSHVNLPPGKFGWPVLGETVDFVRAIKTRNLPTFLLARTRNYSLKVCKTSLLGHKMAIMSDPSGNKLVFSNENKLVRFWTPGSVSKILNAGVHNPNQVDFYKRQRKLFAEFLRPDSVQNYVKNMDLMTKQHMDSEWIYGSKVKVCSLAKRLAFSVSSGLFMGMDYPEQVLRLEHQFEIVSQGIVSTPIDLPGTAYRRAINAAKLMHAEFSKIIRSKKLQLNNDDSKNISSTCNLMSSLISVTDDEGKLLSEWDIAVMIMAIFIASHETTTSLLTNIVYYLAHHPSVYAIALQEQIKIRSSKGEDELLTWEDTKKMKYSRNFINEVMRIAPPGAGAFREVLHDISYDGFTIPKGWKIFLPFYSTHMHPKYFPDPEKFDPTRFQGDGPAPYSFSPFGGGPRMCLGNEFVRQEALVFMHNLLMNFTWEKLVPDEKMMLGTVSLPAEGLPIKLHKRGSDAAV